MLKLLTLLGCFVAIKAIPYSSQASYCYDCNYASTITYDGDDAGFLACALETEEDQSKVEKSKCASGRCFTRIDNNKLIYRGCADQANLPWAVNPSVVCQKESYEGGSLWVFCSGDLCNSEDISDKSDCSDDKYPAVELWEEENNDFSWLPGGGSNFDDSNDVDSSSPDVWSVNDMYHYSNDRSKVNDYVHGAVIPQEDPMLVKADTDGPYTGEGMYYSRSEYNQDNYETDHQNSYEGEYQQAQAPVDPYQGTAVKAHSSYQHQESPQEAYQPPNDQNPNAYNPYWSYTHRPFYWHPYQSNGYNTYYNYNAPAALSKQSYQPSHNYNENYSKGYEVSETGYHYKSEPKKSHQEEHYKSEPYKTHQQPEKSYEPHYKSDQSPKKSHETENKSYLSSQKSHKSQPPQKSHESKSYQPPQKSYEPKSYQPPQKSHEPKSYQPPQKSHEPKSYQPPEKSHEPRSYQPLQKSHEPKSYQSPKSHESYPKSHQSSPKSYKSEPAKSWQHSNQHYKSEKSGYEAKSQAPHQKPEEIPPSYFPFPKYPAPEPEYDPDWQDDHPQNVLDDPDTRDILDSLQKREQSDDMELYQYQYNSYSPEYNPEADNSLAAKEDVYVPEPAAKYQNNDVEDSTYNPCDGVCYRNPSGLFPDPSRSDRYIQCGTAVYNGNACSCCRKFIRYCPSGMFFDPLIKVCSHNIDYVHGGSSNYYKSLY